MPEAKVAQHQNQETPFIPSHFAFAHKRKDLANIFDGILVLLGLIDMLMSQPFTGGQVRDEDWLKEAKEALRPCLRPCLRPRKPQKPD